MLDNQKNKLQDATENQLTDINKSVKKTEVQNDLKGENTKPLDAEKSDNKEVVKKDTKPDKVEENLSKDTLDEVENQIKEVSEKEINEENVEAEQKEQTGDVKKQEDIVIENGTKEKVTKKNKISQDAVEEVEKHVAKKSENLHKVAQIPMEDYKVLDLSGVVDVIKNLIEEHPIQAIKKHIDVLKKTFNKEFGKLLKEAKTSFLEAGGNTIDFHYENPIQEEYNKTLFDYKKRLKKYYKELEKVYEENLLRKKAIIEELKELIDNGEANSMYKHFKEIQEKWRDVGPVAREHYSDLWRTYHFHVERFYDLLHLRNDLRDLDFKHNLEEKLKLIARAELLVDKKDIKEAFNELQVLHRLWKEEIGPVSRENRDEVWERFSEATKKIHDKRHDYYDVLKDKYKENLLKKKKVIEAIEAYDTSENKTHYDWQKSIKEIGDLRQKFFDLGKVPRSKNNLIWTKFKEATKVFNKKKNIFYKEIKNEQHTNLELKIKLVEQAESYRDSEDWDNVTDVMKRIQSEWKTIGHVPRNQSDKIWNRFKEACNHYFDRLHSKQDAVNEEKFEVYSRKKKYLEELKSEAEKKDFNPDLKMLKSYINKWNELGVVPLKQRYINGKFNKFLDEYFEKLSLDKKESTMIRYQNMINSFVEQKDFRKLENEIQFVRKKLDVITKDKQQLENNMLFFSNTDESNPMIKKILKTINQHENELEIWKAKIQYLRSLDI